MVPESTSYRGEFLKSPHHAAWGLATLGLSFMTAEPLFLMIGAAAYALGWIYLPDLGFFRRWVDRRNEAKASAAAEMELADFSKKRDELLTSLAPSRRNRYHGLVTVCRDIEKAGKENTLSPADPDHDPRLRKLDELMWTYLRMLTIEESLGRFLETEYRDEVPRLVKEAEDEVATLTAEFDEMKAKRAPIEVLDVREKLVASRLERLAVLRKRLQKIEQAKANQALVISEQERLDEQVKLIRADAMASRNADTLTARIDATVEHLDQTNKWLAEMDEFKDMVGNLPETPQRVGYLVFDAPPPLPTPEIKRAAQERTRSKGTQ